MDQMVPAIIPHVFALLYSHLMVQFQPIFLYQILYVKTPVLLDHANSLENYLKTLFTFTSPSSQVYVGLKLFCGRHLEFLHSSGKWVFLDASNCSLSNTTIKDNFNSL